MKVHELIDKLLALPQDTDVLVSGYESGFTIPNPNPTTLAVHRRYEAGEVMGEYVEHTDGYCFDCDEGRPTIQVVAIER